MPTRPNTHDISEDLQEESNFLDGWGEGGGGGGGGGTLVFKFNSYQKVNVPYYLLHDVLHRWKCGTDMTHY